MAKTKTTNRILLVEGKDDKHVILSLLVAHNMPEAFAIKVADKDEGDMDQSGGWEKILNNLDVEIDRSGLECLGILLDADENLQNRWDAVRNRLTGLGYGQIPAIPEPDGTIVHETGKPTVGVWLMPNNQTHGILEDFIAFLVHDLPNNLLWQHVDKSVTDIPTQEVRFPEVRKSKALIHTWLAWQQEPGKPLGQAITAKYMDAQATEAKVLINWLTRLFNETTTDFAT